MKSVHFTVKGKLWLYPSEKASWHFVTVPKKESEKITEQFKSKKRGWGSLVVEATIGKTSWKTSIFPDGKSGTYLLPLKVLVRRNEGIEEGDLVTLNFTIVV